MLSFVVVGLSGLAAFLESETSSEEVSLCPSVVIKKFYLFWRFL